ncbi:MAG: DUF2461 domain-containing protein [Anaerolineae bacterium]
MDFAALVQFLAELEQNNNKTWFEANSKRYDALRADFTDLVAEVVFGVATFDPRIQGVLAKDTLFRIHRDVRFARDKVPYKTQFSSSITDRGRIGAPGYYFQVDHTGRLMAGGGLWRPETDILARIRTYIAQRPAALDTLLEDETFMEMFGDFDGPRLQRPPRGFDETTPHLEHVKLKSFTVGREVEVGSLGEDEAAPFIVETFRAMYPAIQWLRDAVHAPRPNA